MLKAQWPEADMWPEGDHVAEPRMEGPRMCRPCATLAFVPLPEGLRKRVQHHLATQTASCTSG